MTPSENDLRDAVARVDLLTIFPELKDRIIAAFGKAAWTDQGGISVHGSDDGGRIAMNHSGWAALPALLDEALGPVAIYLIRLRADLERSREREAEDAREFAARSHQPGNVWMLVRHIEDQCRDFIRERNEWKAVADRDRADLERVADKNDQLRFKVEATEQRLAELAEDTEEAETLLAGIQAVTAVRNTAEAEATRLRALLVDAGEALRVAEKRFTDIAAGRAFQPRPHAAAGSLEALAALAALEKAPTPKEPAR